MAEVPVPEIDMPGQGLPEGEDIGSMKDKIISRLRNYMAKVGMDVPEPEMAAAPEQQIPPAPMGDQQPIVPGEAGAAAAAPTQQVETNLDAARLALAHQQKARAGAIGQGPEVV